MKMTDALAALGPKALMQPDVLRALSGALDDAYFAVLEGRVAAHWTPEHRDEARNAIGTAAQALDRIRHVIRRAGDIDPEAGQ